MFHLNFMYFRFINVNCFILLNVLCQLHWRFQVNDINKQSLPNIKFLTDKRIQSLCFTMAPKLLTFKQCCYLQLSLLEQEYSIENICQ